MVAHSPTRTVAVPGPRALPKIGGMLQLRGNPLARVRELRARYGGVVKLGPLKDRTMYLLTDPTVVKHVLLDNHKNYKKGLPAQRMRPLLGSGSLLLEGDAWRKRRRLIQPAFNKQKVASLDGAFVRATDEMLKRWESAIARGTPVEAREEALGLAMRLTLANMFRVEGAELAPLVEAWQTLYNGLSASRSRIVPRPSWFPDRARDEAAAAKATVQRILGELIESRKVHDDGSVLAALLRARDEEGDGSGLTADELRDEVMTLFIGGYETTSNALGFTLAMIAARPDIAARQREEIDRVVGTRIPTAADLEQLPYTCAILDESLRRFPPSWLITREALADDVIGGFPVKAGDQILVSSYGLHHAPELWPQPDEFRPERFLPDAVRPPRFAHMPFGGGPRVCIGDLYALTEIRLALVRVAQRATLRLAPGTRIEAEAHIGLRPKYALKIIPSLR